MLVGSNINDEGAQKPAAQLTVMNKDVKYNVRIFAFRLFLVSTAL